MVGFTQVQDTAYLYVIVRSDLSPSQIAVHTSHAVLQAAKDLKLTNWDDHPHFVVCSVKSAEQLLNSSDYLTNNNIDHSVWYEPDFNNEPMALATTLLSGKTRRLLRKFQLLKN